MLAASCRSAVSPAGQRAMATLLAAYGQSLVALYPCVGCVYCVARHSPGVPWLGSIVAMAGLARSGHCGAKALHVCKLAAGARTVMPCVVTKLPTGTLLARLLLASFGGVAGNVAAAGTAAFVAPCAGVAAGSVATGLFWFLAIVFTFCCGPSNMPGPVV